MLECDCYLQEVFDVGIVVSFLLNQCGAVQLTRTESAHTRNIHLQKDDDERSPVCEETVGR